MQGLEHPVTHDLYEPDGAGRVLVTRRDCRAGIYAPDGHWLEGDKFDADPHMCGWIAGPRGVHRMMNTASH
jgi:hypothetical protein